MNKKKIITLFIIILVIIVGLIVKFKIENDKKNYELEEIKEYKYFLLYSGNKMGIINTTGDIIIEPKYDSIQIPNPSKDVFICLYDYNVQTEEYKSIVLNKEKEEIFDKFEEVTAISLNGISSEIPFEKSILKFKKDNKYGIIDLNGKVIVNPIYDSIEGLTYKEGELIVKKNEKYGVVNMKGAVIVKPEYDSIIADNYYNKENKYKFSGYIVSKKIDNSYLYGYISSNGNQLLKIEYTSISRIVDIQNTNDIYLLVQDKTKTGLAKNKDIVIDIQYSELKYDRANNVIIARQNAKSGIIDLQGKIIIPIKYDELSIKGIYVFAKNNDNISYFDIDGNEIENAKYQGIYKTNNEKFYIAVSNNSLYGLLDKNQNELIECKYTYLEYLFDNYFIVYDKKLGIIDSNGNYIINPEYDVINKIDGTNIIQANKIAQNTIEIYSNKIKNIGTFTNANISIKNDYVEVLSEGKTSYYNKEGKILSNTEVYNNELYTISTNGKWGFKNNNGEIVVECIYDEVTEFNEFGYAGIKKDGKWGVIDKAGKVILEPKYTFSNINEKPSFINKYYRVFYGNGSSYYTE